MLKLNIPEARRDLSITDDDWLKLLYPWLDQNPNWWLEFRFVEDRPDGAKTPPVSVCFLREPEEIASHLRDHRALAAARAAELRRDPHGPWPAGLLWGLQPRVSKRSGRDRVAATVALTVRLTVSDLGLCPATERPRQIWHALHQCPQRPSVITWGDEIFEAWWLLREPLADKRRGEEAQRAIANYFRVPTADAGCFCRWPNTFSYQRLPEGRPRSVQVVWWQPDRLAFQALYESFLPHAPSTPMRAVQRRDGLVWKRFDELLRAHEQFRQFWQGHPGPINATDQFTLNVKLATMMVDLGEMSRPDFVTVSALAAWNTEPAPTPGALARAYDEATRPEVRVQSPTLAPGEPNASQPHSLPDSAWTEWARLYRCAVKDATEAPDEFHYLSLLTVLGSAFGRNLAVYCGGLIYPNMYTVLVGPTGDRKSTAAQMAMDLLLRVAPKMLFLNGVGSQEGLMERMAHGEPSRHRTLLSSDELASLLKKARRESSGTLIEFITEVFHCPDFKTHSTRSKAIHLERPTLSILSGSTPVWLEAALQQEDILSGFANRFVYVTASPKPDNPLPSRPNQEALKELAAWIKRATEAIPREVGWSSEAQRIWTDFYTHWRRSQAVVGEHVSALLRRIDLYILKFASMAAAMDGVLVISPAHLTSAIELGRFLANCACRLLGDLGSSGDYRLETLVQQKLEEAQGQMTRKELRQTLGGRISGEKLDRVLTAMERNGIVCQVLQPANRGTTKIVQLT